MPCGIVGVKVAEEHPILVSDPRFMTLVDARVLGKDAFSTEKMSNVDKPPL